VRTCSRLGSIDSTEGYGSTHRQTELANIPFVTHFQLGPAVAWHLGWCSLSSEGVDTVELPDSRDALCAASTDILQLLHTQTYHISHQVAY
jgi:hypothetical protein